MTYHHAVEALLALIKRLYRDVDVIGEEEDPATHGVTLQLKLRDCEVYGVFNIDPTAVAEVRTSERAAAWMRLKRVELDELVRYMRKEANQGNT